MKVRYTICYLGIIMIYAIIMIIIAYCVFKSHNMLLSSIMIFEAYCVGKVHNVLP